MQLCCKGYLLLHMPAHMSKLTKVLGEKDNRMLATSLVICQRLFKQDRHNTGDLFYLFVATCILQFDESNHLYCNFVESNIVTDYRSCFAEGKIKCYVG